MSMTPFKLIDFGDGDLPPNTLARFDGWHGEARAADIIDLCRWRDNRIAPDVAVSQWLDQFGQLAAAAKRKWELLPTDRKEIRIEEFRRAIANVEHLMLVAVQAHVQAERPLPPPMLTALACCMGLALWSERDPPIPSEKLRRYLGLPMAHRPHYPQGFFEAARLVKAALERGEVPVNSAIAREIGVKSHNTIAKWLREFDLVRFANGNSADPFFPLGIDAVPLESAMGDREHVAAWCDDVARMFASFWRKRYADNTKFRDRDIRQLNVVRRAWLWRVALQSTRRGLPPPPHLAHALAHLFNLVSHKTGDGVPLLAVFAGYPEGIEKLDRFGIAAKADAEAFVEALQDGGVLEVAFRIYRSEVERSGTTLLEALKGVRKLPTKIANDGDVLRRWWPLLGKELHAKTGIPQPTISVWRGRPDYRDHMLALAFG